MGYFVMFEIDGHTKLLALVGNPVEHSLSPMIHNFISEQLGQNYVYSTFCVKDDDVKGAIEGMRALGIRGFNVTAPHKIRVMEYLDKISPEAQKEHSVNTIVNKDGVLYGYSTDGEGFVRSLMSDGIEVKNKNILILGAGGVARPIALRLIEEKPASVTILNRTMQKAHNLAEKIYSQTGYKVNTEIYKLDFDVIINTTSAGMADKKDILPTDSIAEIQNLDFVNENTVAVDLIYRPSKTRFLQECEKRGAKIQNGLGMLVWQAVVAYELFADVTVDAETVSRLMDKIKEQI